MMFVHPRKDVRCRYKNFVIVPSISRFVREKFLPQPSRKTQNQIYGTLNKNKKTKP